MDGDGINDDEDKCITVDGHTDNTGNAEKNQTLSEARVASVQAYLESKGITADRLSTALFWFTLFTYCGGYLFFCSQKKQ